LLRAELIEYGVREAADIEVAADGGRDVFGVDVGGGGEVEEGV
jgi:hypothetical protein